MNKIYINMGLVLMLMLVSVSGALDIKVSPTTINIPINGETYATATVLINGIPESNVYVKVKSWCKDIGVKGYVCNPFEDIMMTDEIDVSVEPMTDINGNVLVTLKHIGTEYGNYHYTLCVADTSEECMEFGAEVTGDAYIPEFSIIVSGMLLIGLGLIVIKNREHIHE